MEVSKLSKKSLHWRLATVYGPLSDWNDKHVDDICTYLRAVINGFLRVIGLTILCCIIFGITTGDALAWVVAMLATGQYIQPNEMAAGFAAMICLVVVAAIAISGGILIEKLESAKIEKRNQQRLENGELIVKEPVSFFQEVYRKWKNKTCFKVEIS